jgi:hypothetical protein
VRKNQGEEESEESHHQPEGKIMRRLLIVVTVLVFSLLGSAASAVAASPWWHLSSGSRPSNLSSGVAQNETQQLTVSATAGKFVLIEEKAFEYRFFPWNATHTEVQAGLEELYGAGDVEVSGGPGDEEATHPYEITFIGALADRPVQLINAIFSAPYLSCVGATGPNCKRESKITELTQGRPDGELILRAANLGDADATGAITLTDTLPPGLEAVSIRGGLATFGGALGKSPVKCVLVTLTCTLAADVPPYALLEVLIGVSVSPAASAAESNRLAISGGAAPPASLTRPLRIGATTPFGVEEYEMRPEEEGGALDARAGSHPFQLTTQVTLDQRAAESRKTLYNVEPAALPKDVGAELPAGLIGNPTPFPACTLAQFLSNAENNPNTDTTNCPPATSLGVAITAFNEPNGLGLFTAAEPIYNLEPAAGEPARFGFRLPATPVTIDASVRSDGDYGLTATSHDISQTAGLLSSQLVFWGVPGDPRHDAARGRACLQEARGLATGGGESPCAPLNQPHPPAFMTMPTACSGTPLQTSLLADSWAQPGALLSIAPDSPMPTLDSCNQLPFSPAISAEPTTDKASAPSGLDLNIDFHDEGLLNHEGLAQSQLNKTVVTLPEGFTINPSSGVGLAGCTSADYAAETVNSAPGAGCPNNSKLGTVEIETPLLAKKIQGSLFIAQPHENPFGSLVALYIVAKNPETGVLIKLAGKVTPNPVTGQLVTTFENNPQLPFDHFNFHFREGQQAPLVTPAACGTYTVQAQLSPWSDPMTAVTDASSFTITKGFDGGACPAGGAAPFHPQIAAGSLNNNAASFSPLYVHLTRTDGEQEISSFSTNLPSGLTGDLSGIPFCPEANIALARTKTGMQEETSPSCPAQSQIGHTLVGTGVGAVLAYVPGKIYLAGPYRGDPFSIVSVTSAVVGPFDLGTVVIRFGLRIDPYTAQASVDRAGSEPIPTIIQGIVTHVRDIRVYVDRQNFTLNPTSCNPLAISSTLSSDLGQSATVTSPFQAVNCANLKFAPKFQVSTSGKTSRAKGASLAVKLTYPTGSLGSDANIARVKVDLPKQLPSRLTTLQKACTAAQFEANPAGCPAASFIGHAKAVTPLIPVPLEGPAIFVSHGGEAFPSLIMVLQGYGVTIDLVGSTFISKAGITSSTFKTVPDQPIGSFELTLPEGKYSALAANGNLCKSKLKMPTEFLAQNGAVIHQSTKISVTGCGKGKKATKKHKKGRGKAKKK